MALLAQILPNLKFIDLSHSRLKRFPDISGAPHIERLILSHCGQLVEVHQSLGFHRKLVYLDMTGCRSLKSLPSRIEMESLETLILSNCSSLERFPEVSPYMKNLSRIYLDRCYEIEELPSSIGALSGLEFLNLTNCRNLRRIPNSIIELNNLKSLDLRHCVKLQKLPKEIGSMEKLEELLLGSSKWGLDGIQQVISFHSLTSFCSLIKLDLSWRQIEEKDFPKNFTAFSSLEELYLSGNSKLIQLPAGISHLSHLKLLGLNNCCHLQNLHGLPSGIQVLKAQGCLSLEKIGDLTEECGWLYKIWLLDCHKLMEDQEYAGYLDKMLQKSFLEKCAAVNHRLSIGIPGSLIPSWFDERRPGCNVALKLPPKWHTRVGGFAICGVFRGNWELSCPRFIFRFVNDKKLIPKSKVDTGSSTTNNGNLWVSYIPVGFIQQMYHDFQPQDWSHIEGHLVMTIMRTDGEESVRCGARIVFQEDLESIQEFETCISDYGSLVPVDGDEVLGYVEKASASVYVYEEKADDKNSSMISQSRMAYDRSRIVIMRASE